ncbi:MAG TPA: TolC family protein [Bryobacteraceae bacterium]|jgi:outer membrane protein TolC
MRNVLRVALLSLPLALRAQPQPAPAAVLSINLADALTRARNYNAQFLAAGIAASLAREDKVQAKAALFPTVEAVNGYLYTQGNGTPNGVFVNNNGVHVYDEQAAVHADVFSFAKQAAYRQAMAGEAAARARQDVAARGLGATVIGSYFGLVSAQRHVVNARRSLDEARNFEDITQKQEQGGEAAHADVIKAQFQRNQRERELAEALTNVEKARLALAVLIFEDLNQSFTVDENLQPDTPVAMPPEILQQAVASSPDIHAAQSAIEQAGFGVKAARAGFLPTFSVDYFYGIDANQFAVRDPEGHRNLGNVVQGTVTVPVWNWGATRSRVRQAELQQQQARLDLRFAQRQIDANTSAFYLEAQAARSQIQGLRASADLAEESLRLTLLQYQAGEATALEVVTSQSTAADARNAYDDGLARYRLALGSIELLTGRY